MAVLALPLAALVLSSTPAFASTTYATGPTLTIFDNTQGTSAAGGQILTVGYNDSLSFEACLDSSDPNQGNHSLSITDGNGWVNTGGVEYGQDGCFQVPMNWTSFTNGGGDALVTSFGGCSNCGGGNTLKANTSDWVGIELNGDLSWTSAAGGESVNYGTSVADAWGASSVGGAPVGLSFSGSTPSGIGWNGSGFYGSADQDGSFGGTITAIEYGSNSTSASITGNWAESVNPVPPGWTSAPTSRTVDVGVGGWSDTFSVSSGPTSSIAISSGSLPPGVGLVDNANNTATISGTPSVSDSYTATISATNPGGTISSNYTVGVDQAPVITSSASTSFTAGSAASFGFAVSPGTYPTASFSESGALPIGLSLSAGGILSGSLATGAAGSYPLTVAASNAAGTATTNFTLTVAEPASYRGVSVTATGTGSAGLSANGTGALTALADGPAGVLVDSAGDRFVDDSAGNMIQEIPASNTVAYGVTMGAGEVYDIAGNGVSGYTGDDGAGYAAELSHPGGIALDASGNLWIADTNNNVVRVLVAHSGTIVGQAVSAGDIYTFVGTGTSGYHGDGGPATAARLDAPSGVALDAAGNVFIADSGNDVIREVTSTSSGSLVLGDIATVVGTGSAGSFTSGATATAAALSDPTAIALGPDGNLYVADSGSNVIAVDAIFSGTVFGHSVSAGHLYDLAGDGTAGTSGNGGAAAGALVDHPSGLALDAAGDLYFSDASEGDLRVIAVSGTSSLFGLSTTTGDVYQLDSGLSDSLGIAVDPSGAVYVAEGTANKVALLGTAAAITSASNMGFAANAIGSFTVAATGQPAPSFTESGALPGGVTLTSGGVLSGTPLRGTAGTYPITLRAANGIGSVPSQSFTLTVTAAATSLSMSVSPSAPIVANSATITVAVSPTPDAGTTVAISDAKGYLHCPAAPVSSTSGLATCATSATINSTSSDLVSASFGGDSQYAASAGSLTIIPVKAPTTISLAATPGAPTALTSTTLRVTVSPFPDGGSVAFSDTEGYVTGCGAIAVNTTTGVATCVTRTLLLPGLDAFSATYSGDVSYLGSATATLPITVQRAVTSIAITTNPSPLTVEHPGAYLATVSGPAGPVTTGTVAFGDTGGSIVAGDGCGAVALDASGVAQCSVANVASVSGDTITAAYAGAALYAPSTATAEVSPNQRTTSLQLGVSTTALIVGQSSTLTATLDQPAITGTVAFSDTSGLVSGCSAVVVSPVTSTATCATASPSATGSDAITVSYSGDTNDTAVAATTTTPIDSEPRVTSSTSLTATVGRAFSATLTTSGTPVVGAIAINGGTLPPGLSLADNHNGTATISGTLSQGGGGSYSIGLALDDGALPSVTDDVSFVVDDAPHFSTSSSAVCVAGSPCAISISTTGYPNAHLGEAAALPAGLHFVDNGDGTADIVGTAAASDVGTVTFVISASNGVGTGATQNFTLTVSANTSAPPASNPVSTSASSSSSSSGSGGNATSKTPAPLGLTSYLVKGFLSGGVQQTITCSVAPSAVHESATKGQLSELGFSLSCKAGKDKVTLAGSITAKKETKKHTTMAGKVVTTHTVVWLGGFQLSEPAHDLTLTVSAENATVNGHLVLATKATGTALLGLVRKSFTLSLRLTPRYAA